MCACVRVRVRVCACYIQCVFLCAPRTDSISFDLSMKKHAWIGLGLSASGKMKNAYAVIGAAQSGVCVCVCVCVCAEERRIMQVSKMHGRKADHTHTSERLCSVSAARARVSVLFFFLFSL